MDVHGAKQTLKCMACYSSYKGISVCSEKKMLADLVCVNIQPIFTCKDPREGANSTLTDYSTPR